MAKPKHGRWKNRDKRPSSSVTRPHPAHALSRTFPRFPSPAILSALAVIATTPPVVAGSPLPLPTPPPTFLCPFIERDNIDTSSQIFLSPSLTIPSTSAPSPTVVPRAHHNKHQLVADRYVEGSDNLWRKTNQWTLYGSTCCSNSATAGTSGTEFQPNSTQTPMPSSSTAFDTSALPAGWDDATNSTSNTESTIILALAIALAGSICIFMIGCLIWRKRKKRMRDIERKLQHKLAADDDSRDTVREKDARGKMRMWAKATARWKSNIRQSARRRRKRPVGPAMANRPLSPNFCDSQVSIIAPSTPSPQASFVVEPDSSSPELVSCPDSELPDIRYDPPRSASPPTYGASLVPIFPRLSPSSAVSHTSLTPPLDCPHSPQHSNQPSPIEDEPLPYTPRSDGHIAIDDKAQLARIRELASSPPMIVDAASTSTTQSVSAPEWHEVEDDMENLGTDLGQVSTSLQNVGLPPFPPLPSKADVSFGYLGDLSLRYGEGGGIPVLPIRVSSGSSSEVSPSVPPIDYPNLEPSAPSLEGEDDLYQDWDRTSSCIPEVPANVDQDSAPASVTELSIPTTVPSTSRASSSPTRAARDSILPQYYP